MRTNVAEMASNGGTTAAINSQDPVVDGQMLRVHTKLALFGHLLAKDWTERQQQLDQVAFFIGADRLRCEPGLPEKLYHFALRLFQADKSGVVNGDHQTAAFEALVEEVRMQVAKMGNAEMAEDEEGTRDILEQLGQIGVWETRLSAELLERMVEDAKKVGETLKVVKTGSSRVTRKQTKKHSQVRRESNGPWTVHRYDKDKKAVELPSAVETVERQEKGPTALLTRSRSSPTQSSKQSDARRRRRKRMDMFGTLAQGFGLSLLTGFLGNWISETVDISQTLTNWLLLALRPWRLWRGERPRIIWTVDVRRKKRERGIAQFIERLYLTLFIKLAEVKGRALTEMMHEVEDYIRTAIRQEGIETGKLDLNNVLSELDLFTYRSVRHHVKDRYLKKGQRAAQQWQSQMNTIRAMEEMKYFSERRFESERDKILAEMSATEREQYWAEETVKRPGTFAPTLAVFVKNERAAQISAIKGAEPAKQQLRVVDLGELERELRGKERDQRMLEQRVREMANSAGQLSSSGVDLKLIARKIRENEADIQLKQRENGALKKLLEEHQKLESARKGVDKAKEKLQQMTLKSGNAQVQVLDDMQLTALKTLAQLQVLSVLVESLIGDVKAEMVELGGSNWTDERLAPFKRGFEKVLSLVDRLALDKVAIGKKKKAYKNTFKSKLSSVRRAITRMTGLGGRLSGRQTSQVAAVTSENFNNVLLERIAELAYLVEVALKKVKNKKAGTGRNKSDAKGEKGEALLSLNGGSEFGGEWAECEVRKLMRQIVAEANGEEELEQKEGEEGDGDCDQSAMDGLTGAAQKDATGAREH